MGPHDHHDRVSPELLRVIPPDAQVIVEVGRGAGALASAYRRINPKVRYLGIEIEPAAAVVEPVACGLDAADPGVDCLILDDALEYMVDPGAVLARMARWVREEGQILACVPNIQHYAVIVSLLRGSRRCQDESPLDRAHLRFFTLEGIQDLFARAGLSVFDILPRWSADADAERFQQVMAPALGPLGIDPARFASQTRASHYVVRAVRGPGPSRRMVIWSLLGSVIGSEVRVQEPNRFLATIPGVRTLSGTGVQFADLGRTLPDEEKVFLQQRVIIPTSDHLRLQRALIENDYLIVAEFDDDPLHFADLVASDFFALRSCHAVQTTTEVMAATLRAYNPHVEVFPNQLAALPPPRTFPSMAPAPPTLFFGALNREDDWAPVMPAINRVLQERRGRVRVQVVYDRAFFDALETGDKVFEPLCAYDRYHALLGQADIALLPLEPTRFNRHKSDLKFLESAAHGVAVLASPTVYGEVIRHGVTGLIYESPDHFAVQLTRLVDDEGLRGHLAANAYHHVAAQRLLGRHYKARHDWYQSMRERLPELNRELRDRLPELF